MLKNGFGININQVKCKKMNSVKNTLVRVSDGEKINRYDLTSGF